ncbi:MAG: sigma D regulator [Porticoccaceae bacterium]|nr:sigma D regulator [Porticoccaceae bacterium]
MLDNCQTLLDHWGGVNEIIDRWLEERRELLVKYCELSEIQAFDGGNTEHGNKLQGFCELMVDYVSVGHFEVFEQLASEGKAFSDNEGLRVGAELVEAIQPSTEALLDFNDKYLATDDLQALTTDLSTIGEVLAQRFESEDKMIEVLHNAHVPALLEGSQTNSVQ